MEIGTGVGQAIANAVTTSAVEISRDHVATIAQSAVEGAIHAGAANWHATNWQNANWQNTVEAVVAGAVQGATGAVAAQEGKRTVDPRTVAALTAALKDSDKEVRETAMHALVQLRDPSIFEPLVQALKDPSPDVREQAAHGLGQLRDKRAIDPLMGALKDSNADVRENAIHALSQLRDPRTVAARRTAASIRRWPSRCCLRTSAGSMAWRRPARFKAAARRPTGMARGSWGHRNAPGAG